MRNSIFINYRRSENTKDARALATILKQKFGRSSTFVDYDGLDGSSDWLHELERRIAGSKVVLSLIGKDWANITDDSGRRRLENNDDFVRLELAEAFRRDIPVIPVLIDDAEMPNATDLPANLLLLTRPQAERLTSISYDDGLRKLISRINTELTRKKNNNRFLHFVFLIGLVITSGVGVAAGMYFEKQRSLQRENLLKTENEDTIKKISIELEELRSQLRSTKINTEKLERLATERFNALRAISNTPLSRIHKYSIRNQRME